MPTDAIHSVSDYRGMCVVVLRLTISTVTVLLSESAADRDFLGFAERRHSERYYRWRVAVQLGNSLVNKGFQLRRPGVRHRKRLQ